MAMLIEVAIYSLFCLQVIVPSLDAASPGATYTRWGRDTCPTGAKVVYNGYVGGSGHTQVGGGFNYLCMPANPHYGKIIPGYQGSTGQVYGAEYQISDGYQNNNQPFSFENNYGQNLHDQDVPCVVCVNPTKHLTLMIPAVKNCTKSDWNLEYSGYLMTQFRDHKKGDYICVDAVPSASPHGYENLDGAILYPVEARCGSLQCPKYIDGFELTCAVCTH